MRGGRATKILAACTVLVLGAALVVLGVLRIAPLGGAAPTPARQTLPAEGEAGPGPAAPGPDTRDGSASSPADTGSPAPVAAPWTVPAEGSRLHGSRFGSVDGFLVFRGNPTRTFYGVGPVPEEPRILWRYPEERMCSIEGDLDDGGRRWCGIGWTGQPLVRVHGGRTEVIVGGYDGALHFVDAASGLASRSPFVTGAMVKGTEALDPDGFPLVYSGSRDGFLRVIALDRDEPSELWRLGRHPQGVWNDDWDASPTMLDDVLYIAGEDSWFRMVRLHRSVGPDGLVRVDPEVLIEVPGFDDALFARLGDRNVSIESSPAITAEHVYWVNSGGRVMGIDRAAALEGRLVVTLDVWVGDDADASIVVDRDGMLYVAIEEERLLPAAEGIGQLVKLDPSRPDDPFVWGLDIPGRTLPVPPAEREPGGVWATPALYDEWLYVPTHAGDLLVVDRRDGQVVWRERLGYHEWSSPAVIERSDGAARLVVGTCGAPGVRAYDLTVPSAPVELWRIALPGCIESTPIVWRGAIYVGSRDGFLYAIG
jgi:outer membrane protein assembly factor BamB